MDFRGKVPNIKGRRVLFGLLLVIAGALIFFQNCSQSFQLTDEGSIELSTSQGIRPCPVANGTGQLNSLDRCEVVACDQLYHPDRSSNSCVWNVQSCFILNGTGEQNWGSTGWELCQLKACLPGYHQENNQCLANTQECDAGGGLSGTQTWQAGAWGVCSANSCGTGQHLENGVCRANTTSCLVNNGTGTQTWNGSAWGSCVVQSCQSGFHNENNSCLADSRSCSTATGEGLQTWTGSAWSTCQITSCASGAHIENNNCVLNSRTCTLTNGTGVQTWQSGLWGSCQASACQESFHLESGQCVNDMKICQTPAGRAGAQAWSASGWSSCLSCDLGYTSFGSVCIDNANLVRHYYSYLPSCWGDGVFTCPASPVLGAIGVPNKFVASASDDLVFTITYGGASQISLRASDVQLEGASEGCQVSLSTPANPSQREVHLKGCSGVGALRISVPAGTATSVGGAVCSGFGPSSDVMISNAEVLPNLSLTTFSNLTYTGANGSAIGFEAYAPVDFQTRPPLPVVIWIHGGGWNGGSYSMDAPIAKAIASAGFLVVNADYRLANNSNQTYPAIVEPAAPYHDGSDDIMALVAYVKANAAVLNGDPNKISLAGGSAGGHLVALQATRPDNLVRYRCVADLAGPTELKSLRNAALYPVSAWIVGSVYGSNKTILDQNSPAVLSASLKVETLGIFHQIEDNLVPIDQVLQLTSQLKKVLPNQKMIINLAGTDNPNPIFNPVPAEVTHVYDDPAISNLALKTFFYGHCRN